MSEQQVYFIDENSKKYIKLQKNSNNLFINFFKPALISGIIMLILAFIGDEILNIDILFVVYIFLLINIYNIIICIIRWVRFMKIGNSCIIKSNNELLILYGDTVQHLIRLANTGVINGGIIAQSHSNVVKAAGAGISAISAMKAKEDSNETPNLSDVNEVQNITIETIINDPKTSYDYYSDIKFIKQNKNYLYFSGNKNKYDGSVKNENFKLDKRIYKNIDNILK